MRSCLSSLTPGLIAASDQQPHQDADAEAAEDGTQRTMRDDVTHAVYRVAGLLLHPARGFADGTFTFESMVTGKGAGGALHASTDGIGCTADLIFVHGLLRPSY